MKKENYTKITLNQFNNLPKGKTDWLRVQNMTEEEITRNALEDEDNPPLTNEMFSPFCRVYPVKEVDVQKIRRKLSLTQEQFAHYFGVSVRTIQQWEQHRSKPNTVARNFLRVIDHDPRAVQRALGAPGEKSLV